MLKEILEMKDKRVLITHFADLVKYICKQYFDWDGNKDEKGRTLLQKVGTEKVRTVYPDFWVGFIYQILNVFQDEWDYVLIPDTRFPNEINYLRDNGLDCISLRINRMGFENSLTEEQKLHPSEISLDDYNFDNVLCVRNEKKDLWETLKMWHKETEGLNN